ncbi:MAG: hypothetical protein CMJ84_18830 [Planctomycetes bacterium]|nr:hypothetical protein [Planctomycetota bacterium]
MTEPPREFPALTPDEHPWVGYEGGEGPGAGKHLVFVAGDEEYRSEEALPMLARILARRHGFRCTVLFSQDPATGVIDPNNQTHIPGLKAVESADVLILFLRFRELPDRDMKYIVDHVESGGSVIGIRTATHAFDYKRNPKSPYARYSWRNPEWKGGFGRQVLGESWVSHHGGHGSESTRGRIAAEHTEHPILRGVADIWGPTDVYGVRDLPAGTTVLVRGQVLAGMKPDAEPLEGPKNDPMMPLIWIREYEGTEGKAARVLCSTIGASVDFESAGLRRLMVNACYWGAGLESAIPAAADVEFLRPFEPTFFGFGKFRKGVRPCDHRLD